MTKAELIALAEAREKAQATMQHMGAMNAYGRSPEEQVKSAAAYRLASDIAMKADREYQDAIARLSSAELKAIWETTP